MIRTLFFCLLGLCACQQSRDFSLKKLLNQGSPEFKAVLENPKHEVQIIYGQIKEDTIIHHLLNVDSNIFYYPASTVKMPIAFAAAQKLQEMGLSLDTQIQIDSSEHNPRTLSYDSLFNGPITVKNLIKKIFVFSDNQAYNLLYGWLGKDYINQLNHRLGLTSSRITHQLSESAFSFTSESNANSFNVNLSNGEREEYFESELNTFEPSSILQNQIKGVGYMSGEGELVNEAFDFSAKNFISLGDLLGCLERVVKPESFDEASQYTYDQQMHQALAEIMDLRPKDLPYPIDTLSDNYVKFFMYGDIENGDYPGHITIRNKVGWAYGYLSDVAYIRDQKEDIEFFLAATIHVNENQTYNDGVYEYEEVGLPFLAELGRIVYKHELDSSK